MLAPHQGLPAGGLRRWRGGSHEPDCSPRRDDAVAEGDTATGWVLSGLRRAPSQEAELVGAYHGLTPGRRPELAIDAAHVRLDRVPRDVQRRADLALREPAGQETEHGHLPLG